MALKASRPRARAPAPKWIWKGLLSLAVAWTSAHLVTVGSPFWGPGTQHDAIIFGQMIAIGMFPVLFLIGFGTKKVLSGAIIVGIACICAALGLLIHR